MNTNSLICVDGPLKGWTCAPLAFGHTSFTFALRDIDGYTHHYKYRLVPRTSHLRITYR